MNGGDEDPIRFSKAAGGIINGKNWIKVVVFATIACIMYLIFRGGADLVADWKASRAPYAPPVAVAPARVSGDTALQSGGGAIATNETQTSTANTETRSVVYNITNLPFCNGIFGVFGSLFKTQGDETRTERKETVEQKSTEKKNPA